MADSLFEIDAVVDVVAAPLTIELPAATLSDADVDDCSGSVVVSGRRRIDTLPVKFNT